MRGQGGAVVDRIRVGSELEPGLEVRVVELGGDDEDGLVYPPAVRACHRNGCRRQAVRGTAGGDDRQGRSVGIGRLEDDGAGLQPGEHLRAGHDPARPRHREEPEIGLVDEQDRPDAGVEAQEHVVGEGPQDLAQGGLIGGFGRRAGTRSEASERRSGPVGVVGQRPGAEGGVALCGSGGTLGEGGLGVGSGREAADRLVLDVVGEHRRQADGHGDDDHEEDRRRADGDPGGDRPARRQDDPGAEAGRTGKAQPVEGGGGVGREAHLRREEQEQAGGEAEAAEPRARPPRRGDDEQGDTCDPEDDEAGGRRVLDQPGAVGERTGGNEHEAGGDGPARAGVGDEEVAPRDEEGEPGPGDQEDGEVSGEPELGGSSTHGELSVHLLRRRPARRWYDARLSRLETEAPR